jgi:ribonuclease P/MRP protein subunit RPP40
MLFGVSTVWNPSTLVDTLKLESVQRRASKRIRSLRKLGYTARLARLDLTTLEIRRQRGDLIQVYKTINNLETITLCKPLTFTEANRSLRGHKLKLPFENFTSANSNNFASCIARRENFLYSRVTALWNQLPESVVTARSLNSFKARLDKYLSTAPGGHLIELICPYVT